jgi:preprotein translocase subunit YajC
MYMYYPFVKLVLVVLIAIVFYLIFSRMRERKRNKDTKS